MNSKAGTRRSYAKPEIKIYRLEQQSHLMDASFPGGHKKVGDEDDDLNAKQGFLEEDEDASEEQANAWWN